MKPITPLSQNDSRWKNEKLGYGNVTIGNYGCLITACACLARLDSVSQVNEILKANNGFVNETGGLSGGTYLVWNAVNKIPNLTFKYRYYSYDNEKVKQIIKDNGGCIIEVDGAPIGGYRHWLLFIGNAKLIDTWDGKIKSTSSYKPISFVDVEYKEEIMSNTISIAKDTFEKLVQKSTNYDTITKYLIPEANPDTTTAEQLINVVAGIKSRATDQENKAVKAEAELANKIDEISRLKVEIANLESLVKQTEDSLNSNVKQYKILIDEYKGQLTTKQGEIDRLAQELGEANITLAECGTKKEFTEIFELKFGGKVYKFVVMK